jgi:hypothetical protein
MQQAEPRFDRIVVKEKSNDRAVEKHNAKAELGAVLFVRFD